MPTIVFNTRDVGLAIRDHLEQNCITHFEERDLDGDEELVEGERDEVVAVDVSDAHNPIICLDNGQTFTVRIFAGEPPNKATERPKTITALDVFQINDIAAELIDELCRKVQHKMGVTDGGFAGQYFSDSEYHVDMAQIVGEYAEAEFKHHQNSDDVKEGGS